MGMCIPDVAQIPKAKRASADIFDEEPPVCLSVLIEIGVYCQPDVTARKDTNRVRSKKALEWRRQQGRKKQR